MILVTIIGFIRMDDNKPTNIDEYKNWLKKKHNITISRKDQNYYDLVILKVQNDFTTISY